MKNENIRIIWQEFTTKYSYLFKTSEEKWIQKLKIVEIYYEQNNKLPYLSDKDIEIKQLAKWLYRQMENYKSKKEAFKNEETIILWEEFIEKYPCRKFMTDEKYWLNSLDLIKDYINKNNKLPTLYKNTTSLSSWLKRQTKNYENNLQCMKNENIRKHWEKFIIEYKQLF